jgi:hypothetical protein
MSPERKINKKIEAPNVPNIPFDGKMEMPCALLTPHPPPVPVTIPKIRYGDHYMVI